MKCIVRDECLWDELTNITSSNITSFMFVRKEKNHTDNAEVSKSYKNNISNKIRLIG